MKKAIGTLLALLLFAGTLAGCGKDNTAETTAAQTTGAATAVETTQQATETAVPVLSEEQILALSAQDYLKYVSRLSITELSGREKVRLTAVQFLNYIKNKKVDDIARFMNEWYMYEPGTKLNIVKEAFNVFEKIDVDSFEVHLSNNGGVSEYVDARVVLKISKSNSALFPVGTSRWMLRILDNKYIQPDCKPIGLFRNVNNSSIIIFREDLGHTVRFCKACSNLFGFKSIDDFNGWYENAKAAGNNNDEDLANLMIRNRDGFLFGVTEDPWVSRTDLEALAKNTFGITGIDFKKFNSYDSKKDAINLDGFEDEENSATYPATLSESKYDRTTRICTVVIDFYSDYAYLFKSKTMKYTLQVNADDTLKLLSARLIYDSGYAALEYWVR